MSKHEFKVGDEVRVYGVVDGHDRATGRVIVWIPCLDADARIEPDYVHPAPSPQPAKVAQPTPAEVTQATQVYASMERERLWAGFAGQAMASGSTSTMSVLKADAMLAEFYERFRKGGE